MITLIKWMFLGHLHKWKTIRETELDVKQGTEVVAIGMRYVQQCEKCGIVEKRDLV